MKNLVILIVLVVSSINLVAQKQTVNGKLNSWFFWLNTAKVSERIDFTNELHLRQARFLDSKRLSIIRPALNYHVNETVIFSAGYSFIRNWPGDNFAASLPANEHNIWPQVTLNHKAGQFLFSHRFREEIRWTQDVVSNGSEVFTDGYSQVNRFRYRLTITSPTVQIDNFKVALTLFNEVWISQADGFRPVDLNRNWFYVGLDFPLSQSATFHLGLLDQFDKIAPGLFFQQPVLQFMVSSRLGDFRKNKDLNLID
ncbi:DUF2490 domain-containing protein [Luteibaculum oceani]|uniref:DUF2490 domain-containing protein n=1 Tax=Luteibaculum oceani TaxID=1294296 RepID=A0A5C6UYS1_9FLAO|nr:DUF2490 domain-containing protein [Luteibaculum oceani]TXC78633.1 DUF2490 domain-containing protein [Luteibaculum oceani]